MTQHDHNEPDNPCKGKGNTSTDPFWRVTLVFRGVVQGGFSNILERQSETVIYKFKQPMTKNVFGSSSTRKKQTKFSVSVGSLLLDNGCIPYIISFSISFFPKKMWCQLGPGSFPPEASSKSHCLQCNDLSLWTEWSLAGSPWAAVAGAMSVFQVDKTLGEVASSKLLKPNIPHLWRKIIFPAAFEGNMLVPWKAGTFFLHPTKSFWILIWVLDNLGGYNVVRGFGML